MNASGICRINKEKLPKKLLIGVGLLCLLLGLGSLYSYGAGGSGMLIYVADDGNSPIVRVDDMTGAGWITLGTSGRGAKQFSGPHGIFVDTAGKIYVGDNGLSRIVRVNDMTGAGWIALGTLGGGTNQFRYPHGIFLR